MGREETVNGKANIQKGFCRSFKKLEETYHADVDLVKNTMAEITDAELNNPDYVAMFGQKLKAERKSKNITLDQEANQLGINRTTILDMENNPNRKKVNREYLYAVSLFFQNSPWYFLYGSDWDGKQKDGLVPMIFAPDEFVTEATYALKALFSAPEEEKSVNLELLNQIVKLTEVQAETAKTVYNALSTAPAFSKKLKQPIDLERYRISYEDWVDLTLFKRPRLFLCSQDSKEAGNYEPEVRKNDISSIRSLLIQFGVRDSETLKLLFLICISDFNLRKAVCEWLVYGKFLADGRSRHFDESKI